MKYFKKKSKKRVRSLSNLRSKNVGGAQLYTVEFKLHEVETTLDHTSSLDSVVSQNCSSPWRRSRRNNIIWYRIYVGASITLCNRYAAQNATDIQKIRKSLTKCTFKMLSMSTFKTRVDVITIYSVNNNIFFCKCYNHHIWPLINLYYRSQTRMKVLPNRNVYFLMDSK